MTTSFSTIMNYTPCVISKELCKFMGIYLFWSLSHIVASTLYSSYCANYSFWGWFSGGLNAISPHCKAFLWLQNATSNGFSSWWMTASMWLVTKINWITTIPKHV